MNEYKICQYDIKEVQSKMLVILKEIDRICRKYNIKYSLEGGTLLGAVKYKGFVPWDDDIDIVMLRKDYERFLRICKTELHRDFFIQNNKTVKYFPLNYTKVNMNQTVYKQDDIKDINMHHGLFVDLFPVDNVSKKFFRLQAAMVGVLSGARTVKINRKYKINMEVSNRKYKLFIYHIIAILPILFINIVSELICKIFNILQTRYVYEICNPNLKFKPLNRKVYEELIELEFMGEKFLASKYYKSFLKSRFGNIHRILPLAERHPSHKIIKCKLELGKKDIHMKVIHINAVSGIRSTGRICSEIIDCLKENGHKGYIAYSDGIPLKGYKIGTKFDRICHSLFSRLTGKQGYFSRIETFRFLKYLDKIKPDIVHLHNLHGNYINLKILMEYLIKNNIPTVLTLHDCWFFTGKCCHYTVDQCYKWKSGCNHCPRKRKDNPSWFLDRSNKMYHDKKRLFQRMNHLAVVGVSDWITNEARQSYLSDSKIITRIYNWSDLNIFRPVYSDDLRVNMNLMKKFIILGVASFWTADKGLWNFIHLSEILPDNISIIMIGNMEEDLENYKNIIHIRETHDIDTLVKYYSMADVLLNLSMEEACGKVTIEALACGTPVIAFNSTSNPEQIGEHCGYVVEGNDMKGLYTKIIEICSNKKSYYSEHCIEYARKHFNKTDRLNDYITVYKELLSNVKKNDI